MFSLKSSPDKEELGIVCDVDSERMSIVLESELAFLGIPFQVCSAVWRFWEAKETLLSVNGVFVAVIAFPGGVELHVGWAGLSRAFTIVIWLNSFGFLLKFK